MTAILISLAGFGLLCAASAFILHKTLPQEPRRFRVGARVTHAKWGFGTVSGPERSDGLVVVSFDRGFIKLVVIWNLRPAKPEQTNP